MTDVKHYKIAKLRIGKINLDALVFLVLVDLPHNHQEVEHD